MWINKAKYLYEKKTQEEKISNLEYDLKKLQDAIEHYKKLAEMNDEQKKEYYNAKSYEAQQQRKIAEWNRRSMEAIQQNRYSSYFASSVLGQLS